MKTTSLISYTLLNKGKMTTKQIMEEANLNYNQVKGTIVFLRHNQRIKTEVVIENGKKVKYHNLNPFKMNHILYGLRMDGVKV